jgi:Protein of unknown function (DUF3105)
VAKKSRTPAPPRKVQAPKTRVEPRTPDERRRLYIFLAAAAAGLIGLAIALGLVFSASGGGPNEAAVATAMRSAGCTFRVTPASAASQHMQTPDQRVAYNTFPAVSGVHNPTPALWGNYNQQVDPRQAVHNEEHGGIIVWYGPDISADERQTITDFYDESPNAIIVTPLENTFPGVTYQARQPLGSKIALTAWTTRETESGQNAIAICPRVDLAAFRMFRDVFRGKGPERFPVSDLTPGT